MTNEIPPPPEGQETEEKTAAVEQEADVQAELPSYEGQEARESGGDRDIAEGPDETLPSYATLAEPEEAQGALELGDGRHGPHAEEPELGQGEAELSAGSVEAAEKQDGPEGCEREPQLTEHRFTTQDGVDVRETTLTKSYTGEPVNLRSSPEGKQIDEQLRREVRNEGVREGDEVGHKHPAQWGPALGETVEEAAGDRGNVSAQAWTMNRGAGSPWAQMEREVVAYRSENPDSTINVSCTERFVPQKEGDRPISREVRIQDMDGQTPDVLARWTSDHNTAFMNPKTKR